MLFFVYSVVFVFFPSLIVSMLKTLVPQIQAHTFWFFGIFVSAVCFSCTRFLFKGFTQDFHFFNFLPLLGMCLTFLQAEYILSGGIFHTRPFLLTLGEQLFLMTYEHCRTFISNLVGLVGWDRFSNCFFCFLSVTFFIITVWQMTVIKAGQFYFHPKQGIPMQLNYERK